MGFRNAERIAENLPSLFDRNLDMLIALMPAAIAGAVYFGQRALFMMLLCSVVAVAAEWIAGRILNVKTDPRDLSAVVCGLLVAMSMPSGFSILLALCCTAAAVIVAHTMFGGSGCEIISPPALGAALAFVCFPTAMKYNEAFTHTPISDALLLKNAEDVSVLQLLFGGHAGGIGETASVFLIVGAVYLFVRRAASPLIPLSAIISAAALSLCLGMDVLNAVFGGGLLLGTVFMLANEEMCPHYATGKLAYGFVCGVITVIIRRFAVAEEGVYFAILTVNILRPLFSAIPDFRREVVKK